MTIKPYSELSIAVDLIINEYGITNPILIAEAAFLKNLSKY
jgi:hypothetical protein